MLLVQFPHTPAVEDAAELQKATLNIHTHEADSDAGAHVLIVDASPATHF